MTNATNIPAGQIENFRVLRTCGYTAREARAIVLKGMAAEHAREWQGRR